MAEYRVIDDARDTLVLTAAYVATDAIYCLEWDYFTLLFDYERADATGTLQWKLEFSLDGTTWYQSSIYDGGTVTVNTDAESNVQREEFIYGGTANESETFVYGPVELNQFAKWMRVSVMEGTEQVNPGDCGLQVVLSRRKQKTMN